MTNAFYESGYNGLPWSCSTEPETDIFYFDLQALSLSDSLVIELQNAAAEIFKQEPLIIDDRSLEAEIIKRMLPSSLKKNIVDWPSDFPIDCSLSQKWNKKIKLADPELHLLLQYAYHTRSPLVVPRAWLRIVNASWLYSAQKSIGPAYWVYTENERHHAFETIAKTENLTVFGNMFKWSDKVYHSYFNDPLIKDFLLSNNTKTPDNYSIERQLLLKIYEALGGTATDLNQVDKKQWICPQRLMNCLMPLPMQQATFPIHSFYAKYLNLDLDVNQLEKNVYGCVT